MLMIYMQYILVLLSPRIPCLGGTISVTRIHLLLRGCIILWLGKITMGMGISSSSVVVFPEVSFNFRLYNNMVTARLNKTNGINTKSHATTYNPMEHKKWSRIGSCNLLLARQKRT